MSNQIKLKEKDEVVVVSTQLVHARSCRNQKIDLAPSDLNALLITPISRGIVFLKPKPPSSDSNTYLERLKKSLSCTLDSFSPLAGRLARVEHDDDEKTVSFSIDCSNQGAEFVHAITDHVTVADVLDPVFVPPVLHSLFPPKVTWNYECVSTPLLTVQVTELADGVFIGCYMNHSVADGHSFWNFINSWSRISHQEPYQDNHIIISNPPVFDRSLFGTICSDNFPIRVPFPLKDSEELAPPQRVAGLESRVFRFSKTKIAELNARTTAGGGDSNRISSLQSLLAHVWRFMLQNRGANPEDETHLMLPIGTRSRSEVALGDEYFGNAIDVETVTMTVKDVVDDGVVGCVAAALQINKLVASITPDKIRRNLQSWIQNPTVPGGGGEFPPNTFIVADSPRFDVYGNEFGWGNPVAARTKPYNSLDGLWIVLPGEEEGSVDIQICSSARSLEILGNDPHFSH